MPSTLRAGYTFASPKLRESGNYTYASVQDAEGRHQGEVQVRRRYANGKVYATPAGKVFFQKYVVEAFPTIPTLRVRPVKPHKIVMIDGVPEPIYRAPYSDYLSLGNPDVQVYERRAALDVAVFIEEMSRAELRSARVGGRAQDDDIYAAIRDKVYRWLEGRRTVAEEIRHHEQRGLEGYGHYKIVMWHYDGFELWDPNRQILFNERISHVEPGDREITTEVLLDRPLLHITPWCPDWLDREGLTDYAYRVPAGQNCVATQLAICLRMPRKRRINGRNIWVPELLLSDKELEELLDRAWKHYGYKAGTKPFDACEEDDRNWRQLGVTSNMVVYLSRHAHKKFAIVI